MTSNDGDLNLHAGAIDFCGIDRRDKLGMSAQQEVAYKCSRPEMTGTVMGPGGGSAEAIAGMLHRKPW